MFHNALASAQLALILKTNATEETSETPTDHRAELQATTIGYNYTTGTRTQEGKHGLPMLTVDQLYKPSTTKQEIA